MIAKKLVQRAKAKDLKITVAESCTGGMVSSLITDIPGASEIFDRSFTVYSNQAKHDLLGVETALLETHGAVSPEVAVAMAEGALKHSNADRSVAITGIAGPDGGTEEKPVGLVYLASALRDGETYCEHHVFKGDRIRIRTQAAEHALSMLLDSLEEKV